jgi:hypothetical protein
MNDDVSQPKRGLNMKRTLILLATLFLASAAQAQERSASPAGAELYIVSPADGATLSGAITVRFGLKGMGIAPAGVKFDGAGHHHLFIDTALPADMGQPIPPQVDNKILHFGKGQTEVTLTLLAGKHTLQLVLGDFLHVPHNPPVVSKKITVTVK